MWKTYSNISSFKQNKNKNKLVQNCIPSIEWKSHEKWLEKDPTLAEKLVAWQRIRGKERLKEKQREIKVLVLEFNDIINSFPWHPLGTKFFLLFYSF